MWFIYLFRCLKAYLTSLWILVFKEGLLMSLKINTNSLIILERYVHKYNNIQVFSHLVALFFWREVKTLVTIYSEVDEYCSIQFL